MQLYKISFSTTDKSYIGISSTTAESRLKRHREPANKSLIGRAIQKHKNPILTILAECDNWELLCLTEQEAIKKFNSKSPNGYNLTDGGEGTHGRIHTKESRILMSSSLKTAFERPDTRRRCAEKMSKIHSSEKGRISQSNRVKKRWNDPNARQIQSARTSHQWSIAINKVRQSVSLATTWAKRQNRPFSYIDERRFDIKLPQSMPNPIY